MMKIRNYIMTIILAAVSIAAGAQENSLDYYVAVNGRDASDTTKLPLDSISKDVESVAVENIKFTEPSVSIRNAQGNDVSDLFNTRYYIQGYEDNLINKPSATGSSGAEVLSSYDTKNDWYVEYESGNFITGFYSGTAIIHIKATLKADANKTCEGWYKVKVTPYPATLTIYPKEMTVYKNFKFQLPTSAITFGQDDISQYYKPNPRTVPSEFKIVDSNNPEIRTVDVTEPKTFLITWDYEGATVDGKDYSRHYSAVKDTVKVHVLNEEAPSGKTAVNMTWAGDAVSQTVARNDDGTFTGISVGLPNPSTVTTNVPTTSTDKNGKTVTTQHPVLITDLFGFKYEIESVTDDNGNAISAGDANYPVLSHSTDYSSWSIHPNSLGTITLRVTNMDKTLDANGNQQAPTDYEQASLTYIVYVVDRTITVTVNPSTATIPGSWVITNQIWNLPQYSATLSGQPFTDATWYLGLPQGTKTTLDKDPDLTGGPTKTIDGVNYKLYPILSNKSFTANDTIDLTNATAHQFIYWVLPNDETLGNGTYGVQTLTQIAKLDPVLATTYNDVVANLRKGTDNVWTMMPVHTPNLTIKSSTGVDISSYYDVTYHLDKDAAAEGFTIDPNTGQMSYSGSETDPDLADRTITYVTTPKSATSLYALDSITVTVHPQISTFSYEVITAEGSNYGKLHFTGAGTMAAGTRINAVPGLDVQFGKVGGETWNIETVEGETDNLDGGTGNLFVANNGIAATVGTDGIPTAGTYYTLIPYVSGLLTIDADFTQGETYKLVAAQGDGYNQYDESYTATATKHDSIVWQTVLVAGRTYYLYSNGSGIFKVHGFNYTPGYIISQGDAAITSKATIFSNGFIGTNAKIIDSPSENVTFGFDHDGIDYTAYASVDANTGDVTAKRNTQGLGKDNRVPIAAYVSNNEQGSAVVKKAIIRLLISSVPSFTVNLGDAFAAGTELHPSVTENGITTVNTDITVTIGGVLGKYNRSGKDYTDRFKEAEFDESGETGGTVDGFRYRSFGANDTYDENVKTFSRTVKLGQHSSFELPVLGTYLKIETKKSGTVMVYLCHNGIFDYVGQKLETTKNGQPQMTQAKWRPVFITDETGNFVQLGSDAIAASDEDSETPGIYTNSTLKIAYNDSRVRNYALNNPYASSEPAQFLSSFVKSSDEDYDPAYTDCAFSWYRFGDAKKGLKEDYILNDAKRIVKAWKDMAIGQRQHAIKLQQGYCFINKAYVRYTFRIYPGKSYFIWMAGSKPGLAGFSFISDESLGNTQAEKAQVTMTDDETADKFFDKVKGNSNITKVTTVDPITNENIDLYPDFAVNIKRQFGTDKWTSICLPFSMSESQFAETFGKNALIMTYDSITPIQGSNDRFVLHLTQHAKRMIEANRPYFIRPSRTMSDDANVGITIDDVTLQSDYGKLRSTGGEQSGDSIIVSDQKNITDVVNDNGHTQVGTLTAVTAPTKSFIMAGTRLYHITKAYKVPPFRSYIIPNNYLSSSAATPSGARKYTFSTEIYDVKSKTYLDIDNTPTGIEDIYDDGIEEKDSNHVVHGVYNLSGQRVANSINDSLPRGIYIVEGKKVIVK